MKYPLWARGWVLCPHVTIYLGFPAGTTGKESACQCKIHKACGLNSWIEKAPLEEDIFAWRIPWTEECGGLQSMGSWRVRHDWARTHTHAHTHDILPSLHCESNRRSLSTTMGFPGGVRSKEHACQCRRLERLGFDPWVRNNPWGRKWQPTPVLLLEESHGQRILVGYRPWGRKESYTAEST